MQLANQIHSLIMITYKVIHSSKITKRSWQERCFSHVKNLSDETSKYRFDKSYLKNGLVLSMTKKLPQHQ